MKCDTGVGQARHGEHARIEAGRDDEEADGRGDLAGLDQHAPEALPAQPPLGQRQNQRAQRADGAGLGRREQPAIDAAQHQRDEEHDGHERGSPSRPS